LKRVSPEHQNMCASKGSTTKGDRYRDTEGQRCKEVGIQSNSDTGRQRYREAERQGQRLTKKRNIATARQADTRKAMQRQREELQRGRGAEKALVRRQPDLESCSSKTLETTQTLVRQVAATNGNAPHKPTRANCSTETNT
jgi:hypothetical protein